MKLVNLLSWTALVGLVVTSPLHLSIEIDEVEIHVDTDSEPEQRPARVHEEPSVLATAALPIVTLPYEYHIASPDIKSGQKYYNFSNIPFAEPPLGELRFKPAKGLPTSDQKDRPTNDGQETVVCLQHSVGWVPKAQEFLTELFDPTKTLDKKWEKEIETSDYDEFFPVDVEYLSESCLVLDVFVSKSLYDKGSDSKYLAPVIISIHGGGFVFGSKTVFGSPESIMEQARQSGDEVIVVSINYRLGLFGWLGGSKVVSEGGDENVGLTDQLEAIKWVKNNIRKFNGNPDKITLLGESAGASSIMHHLTAYGGNATDDQKPLFQQAIMQSTGFFPQTSDTADSVYREVLNRVRAGSLKDLQKRSFVDLYITNAILTYFAPYGQFKFGPIASVSQGAYVPGPPAELMKAGKFHKDIKVLFANNRREGIIFTPPWLRDSGAVVEHMRDIYYEMNDTSVEVFQKLYGFNGDGLTEKQKVLKAAAPFGDLGVDCNTWSLRQAYPNVSTYEYYYNIYPGFHGQDVGATWWPNAGEGLTNANVEEQSLRLQRYLTSFVKTGDPNKQKADSDKAFSPIGSNAKPSVFFIGSALLPDPKEGAIDKYNDNILVPRVLPYIADPVPDWQTCSFWVDSPWRYPEEDWMQSPLKVQGASQPELEL